MPGFDRNQILCVSNNDLDEFTCGICQNIFVSPLEARCCGQIFCKDCIEEWFRERNTCPSDRRTLDIKDMRSPSRVVLNLMNNMRVKCNYNANGCNTITTMEELHQHLMYCKQNLNSLCETCGLRGGGRADHNCIENMKKEILTLNEIIKACSFEEQTNDVIFNLFRNLNCYYFYIS